MKLLEVERNKKYKVHSIESKDKTLVARLQQLGFNEGQEVTLIRKAPFFNDPILYRIGESAVALAKFESSIIEISEISL